jgi:hypothetical protein
MNAIDHLALTQRLKAKRVSAKVAEANSCRWILKWHIAQTTVGPYPNFDGWVSTGFCVARQTLASKNFATIGACMKNCQGFPQLKSRLATSFLRLATEDARFEHVIRFDSRAIRPKMNAVARVAQW